MEPIADLPLNAPQDISADLARAFDRAGDFMAVQRGDGDPITIEAVILLQESVGITGSARSLFRERLEELTPGSVPGQVLFGLILGLLAAEGAGDKADREEAPA